MHNFNHKNIAASLLAANYANLGSEVYLLTQAGVDWIHIDIMDNHYVPNLTFGSNIIEAILPYCYQSKSSAIPFIDIHLMISPLYNCSIQDSGIIAKFIQSGANLITIHIDSSIHIHRELQNIKNCGVKTGIAFNPAQNLSLIDFSTILDFVDVILIMSVNPGFGGQRFIHNVIEKIKQLRIIIDEYNARNNRCILIQVDGGINTENIIILKNYVDIFVIGNALFTEESYNQIPPKNAEIDLELVHQNDHNQQKYNTTSNDHNNNHNNPNNHMSLYSSYLPNIYNHQQRFMTINKNLLSFKEQLAK